MASAKKYLFKLILTVPAAIMLMPFLASCGKSADNSPTGNNTQLLIANLSPDLLPVNLYINNVQQNSTIYRYPTIGSYFYMGTLGLPLQIRGAGGTQAIKTTSDSITRANAKYTLLVTGLAADASDTTIFLVDTATLPPVGRGKLRFVNASPRSGMLDVYANGVKLYNGIDYLKHSAFVPLPAGNYDIKIYVKGDVTTILKEINPVTVQDSRLYTLYTYGLVGRTDTAAFSAGIITNK